MDSITEGPKPPRAAAIVAGALKVAANSGSDEWKTPAFASLVAQLAHAGAAPQPSTINAPGEAAPPTTDSTNAEAGPSRSGAVLSRASEPHQPLIASLVGDNGTADGGSGDMKGKGKEARAGTGLPTPPLSPMDTTTPSRPPPPYSLLSPILAPAKSTTKRSDLDAVAVPFSHCLSRHYTSPVASLPGRELVTSVSQSLSVPPESVVLLGAAQTLSDYYSGFSRRGPDGEVKLGDRIGSMESCNACGCLDFDLKFLYSAGSVVGTELLEGMEEILAQEWGERECMCGHPFRDHVAWEWEPEEEAEGYDDAVEEMDVDGNTEEDKGTKKEGQDKEEERGDLDLDMDLDLEQMDTKLRTENEATGNWAQTADDSYLFDESDDEDGGYTHGHPPADEPESQPPPPPPPNAPSPILRPAAPQTSSESPAPLVSKLPQISSPGLSHTLRLFCYWTPSAYSSLHHLKPSREHKSSYTDIRPCHDSSCPCADFSFSSTLNDRRHSLSSGMLSLTSLSLFKEGENATPRSLGRQKAKEEKAKGKGKGKDTAAAAESEIGGVEDNHNGGNGKGHARHGSHMSTSGPGSILCVCGHDAHSHAPPELVHDMSWILVEWAYLTLIRVAEELQ